MMMHDTQQPQWCFFVVFVVVVDLLCLGVEAAVQPDGSCPLVTILPLSIQEDFSPFSNVRPEIWPPDFLSKFGFDMVAAMTLAVDHFNARDPSVVPQVDARHVGGDCNVTLTELSVVDSGFRSGGAVAGMLRSMYVAPPTPPAPRRGGGDGNNNNNNINNGNGGRSKAIDNDNNDDSDSVSGGSNSNNACPAAAAEEPPGHRVPCGVIGPSLFGTFRYVLPITAGFDIPQMSPFIPRNFFWGDNSLGLSVSMEQIATAMLTYVAPRKYLCIIATPGLEDTELTDTILAMAPNFGVHVEAVRERNLEGVPLLTATDPWGEAAEAAKLTGIKTIFINLSRPGPIETRYAPALADQGMLTDDFVYILPRDVVPTDRRPATGGTFMAEAKPDAPIRRLLSGALVFDNMDGFRVNPETDRFLAAWRALNRTFADKVKAIMPDLPAGGPSGEKNAIDESYFRTGTPVNYASYAYDAVIALGLGACKAMKMKPREAKNVSVEQQQHGDKQRNRRRPPPHGKNGKGPPPRPPNPYPIPGKPLNLNYTVRTDKLTPHVLGIFRTSFEGASGLVRFTKKGRLSREIDGIHMGLYNVRYPGGMYGEDGRYEHALVSRWTNSTGWLNVEGESIVRRSGARGLMSVSRVVLMENFLPGWVRAVGLSLMGTVWTLAFCAMMMMYNLRSDQEIKRSQPFFLNLVCLGSIVTSSSIFTLSWDEGAGWSGGALSVACALTPWFFFLGNIVVFASLSTKMWRIDKVLQFRRHQVDVRSSLYPLIIMLLVTLGILATWTALDAWKWERITVSSLPSETYGACTSNRLWAFFGPLMAVLVFSEAVTIYFIWKTHDIPEGLSDRLPVMYALVLQLQAWVIGVPVLALLHPSSTGAVYFGRVLLIWIFAMSAPACAVCPKLCDAVRRKLDPGGSARRRRSRVTISGIPDPRRSCDFSLVQPPGSASFAFGGGGSSVFFGRAHQANRRQTLPGADPTTTRTIKSNTTRTATNDNDKSALSAPREESVVIEFGSEGPYASTASTSARTPSTSTLQRPISLHHPQWSSVAEGENEEEEEEASSTDDEVLPRKGTIVCGDADPQRHEDTPL